MATVVLSYTVNAVPNMSTASLATRLAALDLFHGELEMLGMGVQSDITAALPAGATRTITLEVFPAGEVRFPTDEEKIYATIDLYRQSIGGQLPGEVIAALPQPFP